MTTKEHDHYCDRLAVKLKVSRKRVAEAMAEIVREDVRRIAANKKIEERVID